MHKKQVFIKQQITLEQIEKLLEYKYKINKNYNKLIIKKLERHYTKENNQIQNNMKIKILNIYNII